MIFNRIKQVLNYIFIKYDKQNDIEVKEILSNEEFEIFNSMSNYDKVHSFNLYKKLKNSEELSKKSLYLKLALLHDCGKNNSSLIKRIKKVLLGDAFLNMHPLIAYNKLKNINLELAKLCKIHHEETFDADMKIFKNFDDKN